MNLKGIINWPDRQFLCFELLSCKIEILNFSVCMFSDELENDFFPNGVLSNEVSHSLIPCTFILLKWKRWWKEIMSRRRNGRNDVGKGLLLLKGSSSHDLQPPSPLSPPFSSPILIPLIPRMYLMEWREVQWKEGKSCSKWKEEREGRRGIIRWRNVTNRRVDEVILIQKEWRRGGHPWHWRHFRV